MPQRVVLAAEVPGPAGEMTEAGHSPRNSVSFVRALDNPVWRALATRHAHLADGSGPARRYRDGVSVFWSVERHEPGAWDALHELGHDDGTVVLIGPATDPTPEWPVAWRLDGFQMVLDELVEVPMPADVRVLCREDIEAMLALVELTRPGPFLDGTIDMGTYHGVVRDGRLLAMAGERFDLDGDLGDGSSGFREISAVATHPDARGQGLAAGLSTLVAQGILDAGDVPFLHVVGTNTNAIRVYERLGFKVRTPFRFTQYQLP